jgi:glycolate oxidase FAD binding subunit
MATAEAPAKERPASPEEAAELLRALGEGGRAVRVRGGGTKLGWGGAGDPVAVELETGGLDRMVEHNIGDFTAVLQAGVPLAAAQEAFRAEGQMLALDPASWRAATPARCATATAACATSSSASTSRCRTARWRSPAAR